MVREAATRPPITIETRIVPKAFALFLLAIVSLKVVPAAVCSFLLSIRLPPRSLFNPVNPLEASRGRQRMVIPSPIAPVEVLLFGLGFLGSSAYFTLMRYTSVHPVLLWKFAGQPPCAYAMLLPNAM